MNVKKGVSAPRKGQTSLPQTLAHVTFFHIFLTQATTPPLRGQRIGFKKMRGKDTRFIGQLDQKVTWAHLIYTFVEFVKRTRSEN